MSLERESAKSLKKTGHVPKVWYASCEDSGKRFVEDRLEWKPVQKSGSSWPMGGLIREKPLRASSLPTAPLAKSTARSYFVPTRKSLATTAQAVSTSVQTSRADCPITPLRTLPIVLCAINDHSVERGTTPWKRTRERRARNTDHSCRMRTLTTIFFGSDVGHG